MGTFREVAIEKAPKQKLMVDAITNEAPFLAGIPVEPASHGMWNVYEELLSVTGADIVDLDDALPTVDSQSELKQKELSVIGALMEVGEDKARMMGGPKAYFAKKMERILRKTGMDIEANLLYNVFRAYAAENSKLQFAGGSSTTNYSILCVHWVPGEVTGLYNSEGFGNGKAFDLSYVSGGNIYKNALNKLVYGLRMKTDFGVQLANPDYISGIVNCDIINDAPAGTRKFPTAMMIDDMILNARGGANTFIFCHPKVKSYIGSIYKTEKLQLVGADKEYNTIVDAWNGIPIITSFNFLNGSETAVSS